MSCDLGTLCPGRFEPNWANMSYNVRNPAEDLESEWHCACCGREHPIGEIQVRCTTCYSYGLESRCIHVLISAVFKVQDHYLFKKHHEIMQGKL